MSRGWNPWAALREREHLKLRWARLSECREVIVDRPDGRTIYLDSRLDQRARNALLAHALVHDERFLYHRGAPRALVDHDEEQVRRITTDRLVPPTMLDELVATWLAMGEPVHASLIADEFEVPLEIAHKALHLKQIR